MRFPTLGPHIDIIFLICLICVSATTALYGAVDLGDSCFSMSSMSSVLWVRLDTGDEDDANATVITADPAHSCVLPNRRIIEGSWGAELVFEVSPTWQCRLPGDDIELKAKKGGGFISCHEEIHEAEKEVEVMVSYYNHVIATHAALFTTTIATSTTPSTMTATLPITRQSLSIHTTTSSMISPTVHNESIVHNANVHNNKSDESRGNKNSPGKRKNIDYNKDAIENKKKKTNKHLRQHTKVNKRNKDIQKDIGKEQSETAISSVPKHDKNTHSFPHDYSNVTPDISWFTNNKHKKEVHSNTTEKSNDWHFDSSNPYQDDHTYVDSASIGEWDRNPKENSNKYNMKPSDIENMHNRNKETPKDQFLFQYHDGISLSTKEYIIIGTGSVIGIALLISATILIIVLRRKRRDDPVDYWV